jgi:hypothetical protein
MNKSITCTRKEEVLRFKRDGVVASRTTADKLLPVTR